VTKLALLAVRMLRYRVAAMIWLFMLLGAAAHGGLERLTLAHVWAALALGCAYVAATTANDVADRDVDLINHPRDRGRPLVTGEAGERDLAAIHVFAAAGALACGAALGAAGFALSVVSVAIGWIYSLPPLRLSYRTYLAPLVLGAAYVLVPYGFGLVASRGSIGTDDAVFAAGLYAFFIARITLKDFRDRAGDAAYGKPTLLLEFGKTVTCAVSFAALLVGNLFLLASVRPPIGFALVIATFVAAIGSRLYALWRSSGGREEQVAIGIGARMGNGLLVSVLGWLVLTAHGTESDERVAFAVMLAAPFALAFFYLVARPDEAVIGYKG
jgi:homogentisate phytyltransferase / homogentisate geranylgeranyltransferase